MRWSFFFSLFSWPLWAFSSGAALALAASAQTALFPIDANQRGTEIVNTFTLLSPASGIQVPEVALQTNLPKLSYLTYRYLTNGIVPYVQSIGSTPHNTLLIVGYLAPQMATLLQYLVVPVEAISSVLYFPKIGNLPTSSAPFSASYSEMTIPYFSIDPEQRRADIVFVVNQLMSSPYKTANSPSQVWIQTNLSGPYNPPLTGGLIKNVTAISSNQSLIQIQYLPPTSQQLLTLILNPEQVQQILFIANPSYP